MHLSPRRLLLPAALFVLVVFIQLGAVIAQNDPARVTLCHNGTTITVSYASAYGDNGHFLESGEPNVALGHVNDYLGPCVTPTATSDTATATPAMPTETPVMPEVTPDEPTVEATESATPEPPPATGTSIPSLTPEAPTAEATATAAPTDLPTGTPILPTETVIPASLPTASPTTGPVMPTDAPAPTEFPTQEAVQRAAMMLFDAAMIAPLAAGDACLTSSVYVVDNVSFNEFMVDTGNAGRPLRGNYVGYTITNGGSTASGELWVTLDAFTGGRIGLAANEDGIVRVGVLAPGQSVQVYFYLTDSGSGDLNPANITYDVNVYEGVPGAGGIESCDYTDTIIRIRETLEAQANKVHITVAGPNPATIGGTVTMTVVGDTGTNSALIPMVFTPAVLADWPANAYQLVDARLDYWPGDDCPDGAGGVPATTPTVVNDRLHYSGAVGQDSCYRIVYTFIATGATSAPSKVFPATFLGSGQQVKHNGDPNPSDSLCTSDPTTSNCLIPATNTTTLNKSASPTSLVGGGTVTYTITLNNSSATLSIMLDQIRDLMPAGATYVAGSTTFGGSAIADPFVNAQSVVWSNSFRVPASSTRTLIYRAIVPSTPGTYINSAYGLIGSTTIDTTLSTTDNAPATAVVIVPTPTATPVTPTATPITPTATPVTPTATPITPTATPITPTATPITPTATPLTPTATPITPTATPITPTATPITPTATPVTPTATPITPTATPVTPTATPITPTATPVTPTATPITSTATPVTPTATPITPTATPITPTATPLTPTATPITPTATPITPTATPVTPTATPITPTATPVTPTATPVTPTATPITPLSVFVTNTPMPTSTIPVTSGLAGTPSAAPQAATTAPVISTCARQCTGIVVYVGNRDGNWDLFRSAGSAEADVNLTDSAGQEYAFSLSPDDQWVTYASDADGNWEIYVASTSGDLTLRQRLTFNTVAVEADPVWGPSSQIAYTSTRDGNHEIYVFDTITGREFRATDHPGHDMTPSWTPDGQLLFVSDRSGSWQIYRLNLVTGSETLLSDGQDNYASPLMSPDGSLIAYRLLTAGQDGVEQSVMIIMNAEGTGPVAVSDANSHAVNPAWSPDSRYLAFQSDANGNLDVLAYDRAAGQRLTVTTTETNEFAPQFRCDSVTVVFSSDAPDRDVPLLFDQPVRGTDAEARLVSADAESYISRGFSQIYPLSALPRAFASGEGVLPPGVVATRGHTQFTFPDVSVIADTGATLNQPMPYTPIQVCAQPG